MSLSLKSVLVITVLLILPVMAVAEKVVVVPLGGGAPVVESPLIIPASAFREDGSAPGSARYNLLQGYFEGTGNTGCIMAPVYLPDKSTVTQLSGIVYDNNANSNENVYVGLYKTPNSLPLGSSLVMVDFTTTGASGSPYGFIGAGINEPQIDNNNFNYTVGACLNFVNLRLYTVRIVFDQ